MVDTVEFTDIRIADETIDDVVAVLEGGRFVKGPVLERFEDEFAAECGVEHAVGVSSGTAALLLALQAAGVGEGDEVFVPGHTFFASASPVLELGATPVFVDVDPLTYTMDAEALEAAVESADSPAAVVPVHIYGGMAEMDGIREVADGHDLFVLEDACQAHFAARGDDTAGAAGDAGAFSFYPSKNMTVGGDGGMATTDDPELARRMRMLRNHGRDDEGTHRRVGLNYRMDETNAAVGLRQLARIRDWNAARSDAAQRYTERLSDVGAVTTPFVPEASDHVFHLYVIQAPDRDALRTRLERDGIGTGIHYATPAHRHPAIEARVDAPRLPETERLCDRILSLPMHPRITDEEIDHVCESIAAYYG
ncbi:aminotransferase class I/II-fold pyridoxal phosphate-dependent enzyme [Halobellus sp. GM3]|uniref:aminotransferase class I/II-fold pyridoxal phosphate-dependent enzyme n=1 Tax=Halobellus sp. GM3 TaxID=3458410 RepID=UPI00403D722B